MKNEAVEYEPEPRCSQCGYKRDDHRAKTFACPTGNRTFHSKLRYVESKENGPSETKH